MLQVIKEIKKDGLEFVIEKYGLLYKPCYYDKKNQSGDFHKFLLKYGLESRDFKANMAVRECRGLILTKELEVMSLPFVRFFNIEEPHRDEINLAEANLLTKEDGSVLTMYWDWILNCWEVQTSGTADADTIVNSNQDMTFSNLFWDVWETYGTSLDKFDTRKNYVFELCTVYNQVVAHHATKKIVLLNVRNLDDMSEASYDELIEIGKFIGIPAVESHSMNSEAEIRAAFKNMTHEEEGFVAVQYNPETKTNIRVKIKNPEYCLRHNSVTNFTQKDIFTVIKADDKDEFLGILEHYSDLYYKAHYFWLSLALNGYQLRDKVLRFIKLGKSKAISEGIEYKKKDFVYQVKPLFNDGNRMFTGEIYRLYDNYHDIMATGISFDPEDILREIPIKELKDMLNKNTDLDG